MEVAALVIATVSALLEGISTWLAYKDGQRARKAARATLDATLADPRTTPRARHLTSLVPQKTLDRIYAKVKQCYDKMDEMFDNVGEKYFPDDVTKASAGAFRYCVCDSLAIMKNVVGELPDEELKELWRTHNCDERVKQYGPSTARGLSPTAVPQPSIEKA